MDVEVLLFSTVILGRMVYDGSEGTKASVKFLIHT